MQNQELLITEKVLSLMGTSLRCYILSTKESECEIFLRKTRESTQNLYNGNKQMCVHPSRCALTQEGKN